MIKAIIFDCFGVLVHDGWRPFREHHFSHDADLMERAIASNKRSDAGLQTHEDFIQEVAEMAIMDAAEARREIESNPADSELFELISKLKPHYKIGVLSNAGADWLDELFTPKQRDLFDGVVLSYQIGTIKPDPRMYETIAMRLGLEPHECLFVDDQPRYCEGAREIGMAAVAYESANQLTKELKKYNIAI